MISDTPYKRTQIGWVVISISAAIAIASVIKGVSTAGYIGLTVALLCVVFFSTLTVVTDDDGIEVRFGPGPLVHRRIRWSQIRSSHTVRNSWLSGFGIRWIGAGWMYNVSGLDAVELKLANGRRFRIGTDDPAGLDSFIRGRLAARSGDDTR